MKPIICYTVYAAGNKEENFCSCAEKCIIAWQKRKQTHNNLSLQSSTLLYTSANHPQKCRMLNRMSAIGCLLLIWAIIIYCFNLSFFSKEKIIFV